MTTPVQAARRTTMRPHRGLPDCCRGCTVLANLHPLHPRSLASAVFDTAPREQRDRRAAGAGSPPWATLTASEDKGRRVSIGRRDDPDMLTEQVRPWASPTVSDARAGWTQEDAERADRRNLLGDQLGGKRLNPAWVETLMGLPQGWTDTEGPRLTADPSPRWPRGRYPADWDRSIPWPGYDWEPSRTLPDGPPCPGRPARIRLCGNAVVPQQGALAIRAAMEPAQASLWGGK